MTADTKTVKADAPAEGANWARVLVTIADKYTGGDTVQALRELFHSIPTGKALQAINYHYHDDAGVMHAVYGGADFTITKEPGGWGAKVKEFDVFNSEGSVKTVEDYVKRTPEPDLGKALGVVSIQSGYIGRRVAESALEAAKPEKTRRNTKTSKVQERLDRLEALFIASMDKETAEKVMRELGS